VMDLVLETEGGTMSRIAVPAAKLAIAIAVSLGLAAATGSSIYTPWSS
jgi:hypothetical protein